MDVYRLRGIGWVQIRHRSRDTDILREIFGPRSGGYRPPRPMMPLLRGPIRVLDLGGNIGLFGMYAFARWQITSLTSLEPDPTNYGILANVVALNGADGR